MYSYIYWLDVCDESGIRIRTTPACFFVWQIQFRLIHYGRFVFAKASCAGISRCKRGEVRWDGMEGQGTHGEDYLERGMAQ